MRHGRDPKTPVSVVADGTLPTQRKITATLDTVAHDAAEAGIRPPAVVVVGEVVTIAAQIAELCSSQATGAPGGTFLPAVTQAQVEGPAQGNDLVGRPAQ
jgi:uroporphyrin-III C-methyltransferase/precorrin-2 dehydrogenase/sirohydrochlorin ferrochelatase